jgi:phospholipid/cholesterol/gamma-HCH transport system substrate-binding protein
MTRGAVETLVGLFVLAGLLCLAYLAIRLGDVRWFGSRDYIVTATFPSVSGLKEGAGVEIAGVEVGKVEAIALQEDRALVTLRIRDGVVLTDDVIASVRTKGIIGDKYIQLVPGGSEKVIPAGGRIRETVAPVDIEELIGQFIFGRIDKKK